MGRVKTLQSPFLPIYLFNMSDYQAHVDGFMMLLCDLPNDGNVHTHDSMMEQLRTVESAFKRAMELRREEMEADLLVDVALDASLVAQEAAIAAKSAVKKMVKGLWPWSHLSADAYEWTPENQWSEEDALRCRVAAEDEYYGE